MLFSGYLCAVCETAGGLEVHTDSVSNASASVRGVLIAGDIATLSHSVCGLAGALVS